MKISARKFVKMIKDICEEENIDLKSYAGDYIFKLSKNGESRYVYGYKFELNKTSVGSICGDKAGSFEILTDSDVDCVEHEFFIAPSDLMYMDKGGTFKEMVEYLEKHEKVVCKPNDGHGGHNVFLVTNKEELETAADKIFSKTRGMAISPYYDIKNEYRVIVLNDTVKLIFSKKRNTSSWKHNLSEGAVPEIVKDKETIDILTRDSA